MENAMSQLKTAASKPTEPANTDEHCFRAAGSNVASLTGLPVELKILILSHAPDVLALQGLIRSSKSYHTAYLNNRRSIFSAVLPRDVGNQLLPDALAVYDAYKLVKNNDVGSKEGVPACLAPYKLDRENSASNSFESLDIKILESISRRHYLITKISIDFCESTRLVHPQSGARVETSQDLSLNEKR
jgi:hypothetical protein